MRVLHFLRRMRRWLFWRVWDNIVPIPSIVRLCWINRCSSAAIIYPVGPVVSLTTYGKRSRTVYLAIESIGEGSSVLPRIILWLDDRKAIFDNLACNDSSAGAAWTWS